MSNDNITIKDNSPEVLAELNRKIKLILEAIGSTAEGYAKDDCPVDTGRLRNSITYATESVHSNSGGSPATAADSATHGTPEKGAVYIGSNVEYAAAQEYGDYNHKVGKKHFLRDAVANHTAEYKAIIEAVLK